MILLFFMAALFPTASMAQEKSPCAPWEILVARHSLKYHPDKDKPATRTVPRRAHCRDRYRLASTIGPRVQSPSAWSQEEFNILLEAFADVSPYLVRHLPTKIARISMHGHPDNPEAWSPLTDTLWVTDAFFKIPFRTRVLDHELAHILFNRGMTKAERAIFSLASGWRAINRIPVPPGKPFRPDSSDSTTEDFANHVEWVLHGSGEPPPADKALPDLIRSILEAHK